MKRLAKGLCFLIMMMPLAACAAVAGSQPDFTYDEYYDSAFASTVPELELESQFEYELEHGLEPEFGHGLEYEFGLEYELEPQSPIMPLATARDFFEEAQALAANYNGFVRIDETQVDRSRFNFNIFNQGYTMRFGMGEHGFGWGIESPQNQLVVPYDYQALLYYGGYFLAAQSHEGFWGLIDLHGNIVSPFIFTEPPRSLYGNRGNANELYAVVGSCDDGKRRVAIVTTSGRMITPFIYEAIEPSAGQPFFAARYGDVWGIIAEDGNVLLPFEYYNLTHFRDELFHANDGYGWGVVDINGSVLLPMIYAQKVIDIAGNMAAVRMGSTQAGVVETFSGDIIIPKIYRDITFLENDLIGVRAQQGWGIQDSYNQVIVPYDYNASDVELIAILMGNQNLRAAYGNARRVHWFDQLISELGGPRGVPQMELLCLATGRTAMARPIWNGNHADIVGTTNAYQAMLAEFFYVLVVVEGWDFAMPAAIRRFAPSTHFCLHFYGSTQNNNNRAWTRSNHISHGERASYLIGKYIN